MCQGVSMIDLSESPLQTKIENGQLVISIGINTLAYCAEFEGREPFWKYDDDKNDFVQVYKIIDSKGWAEDLVRELNREEEDGSTPLTDLLDKMSENALDDGSLSVWCSGDDPSDPEDCD